MWNKFSIKIQLIVFITLVLTIVELGTLAVILNIQKTQSQENAILDLKNIAKSLNNDFLKIILNTNSDSLSDLTFRLSAFKNLNGVILFNEENNAIYKYGNTKFLQNNQNKIVKNKPIILMENILIKETISADDYSLGYIIIDVDTSIYQKKYIKIMKEIIQIFPFTLLLGILLSLWISKSYTKPFSELIDAMKKSDPTTNNIEIVSTSAQNEIKELFDGFNTQMQQISISTEEINKLNKEIEDTQKEVVFTMGAIGESRSKETGNHVKRVAQYSKIFALHYGLQENEAEMLKQASPMHDIGKVGIPDSILNKPGRFNDAERKVMDTHAKLGYDMLKASNKSLLKLAATVAYEHHEKWDGTGYPNGLKGEDISIAGRITAIADVFDALGSNRVYKKAWNDDEIFKLFKEESGKHFDPKLVDIFFANLNDFLVVREQFIDLV
jgi:response regulator RpfG family c-di-GMP phosphodiesterase